MNTTITYEKIIKAIVFALLLLLNHQSTFSQTAINDSLNIIVAEIDSSNVYEMTYTVGYAGSISKQYLRLQKLSDMASEKKLTDLALNYHNPVVRLYALKALKRFFSIPEHIALTFSNDKSLVNTLSGCYGGISSVSSLAREILGLSKKTALLN